MGIERLTDFVASRNHLLVITGAGVSTGSGIPDYRDSDGQWKRKKPMYYQEFIGEASARQRYWARSMLGWPLFASAKPNANHRALAVIQGQGYVRGLITQNVDGLHQAAGSESVIDLHGRLDQVICLDCQQTLSRQAFQQQLEQENPHWQAQQVQMAPDGDADLGGANYHDFHVPACAHCGGVLKPDVVFFGENVPRQRVQEAHALTQASDGILVLGSSLMVWSGFRFVRAAAEHGVPVMAVNQGKTRADDLLSYKLEANCEQTLSALAAALPQSPSTRFASDTVPTAH